MRTRILIPIFLAGVLFTAPNAHAQATITLTGRVVAGTDARPVAGGSVEVNGRIRVTSDADGQFRLTGVTTGPAQIFVRALGYEDLEINLTLRNDTTIVMRLKDAPLQLERIDAVSRTVEIRGRIIDAETKMGVDGMVFGRPGNRKDDTSGAGRYRVTKVLATDSTSVTVEAFGYLTQTKFINATRDTTIDFEMLVDPLVAAMIRQMEAKIDTRADSLSYLVQTVRGKDFNQAGTIIDVLKHQYDLISWKCIVIDEIIERRSLALMLPDEVQMIEIIDRGKGTQRQRAEMVRIYTRAYFARTLGSTKPLRKVVVHRNGPRELCA